MDIDKRIEALTTSMERFQHSLEDLRNAQQETNKQINRVAVGLNRMRRYALQIALDHEVRIQLLGQLDMNEADDDDLPEESK
jgi:prefoldin subunit 5